jgi:hypothetical protein
MQNFAFGEFSVLQDPHRRVNGDAHSSQNFALSEFSAPHLAQRIAVDPTPSLARRSGLKFVSGNIASVDKALIKMAQCR